MALPTREEALWALNILGQVVDEVVPYNSVAQAFFDRLTTPLATEWKLPVNDFVTGLDSAGLLAKLHGFSILCLPALDQCIVDLTGNEDWDWTVTGSSFALTPGVGLAPGAGGRLDNSYAFPAADQNDCAFGFGSLYPTGVSAFVMGNSTHGAFSKNASNVCYHRVSTSASGTTTMTDGTGNFAFSRTGSAGYTIYRNGQQAGTKTVTSVLPSTHGLTMFGNQETASAQWPGQADHCFAAKGLSTQEVLDLHTLFATFKTAVASL